MAKKATKATPKKRRQTSTARTRATDWKPAFLKNLAETGVIREACRAARIDRATYYRHVKDSADFAAHVDLALEESGDVLEAEAVRRAVDGKSDTMLIFLLKGRKPEKYGERREVTGPGGGPLLFREVVAELQPEAVGDEAQPPVAH